MYDELIKRLRCTQLGKCENCKNSYLEQVEPNLYRERCAAIDAADAIEDMNKILDSAFADNERLRSATDDLIELLLTECDKHRWIPVTERLPEAWEEVMLQFPNNQAAGFFDGDCGWGVFSGDDFYTYVAPEEVHPTHWAKKLPEPPKEET